MIKKTQISFDKELFKRSLEYNVRTMYRREMDEATKEQVFQAAAYALKDQIVDDWMRTQKEFDEKNPKMLYYLSMEFLMGRAFGNNLINLQAYEPVAEALKELGFDINTIEDQEPDPALGNGGLGRLAACFLDSLATLNYPAYGCGIRYRYGMFKQKIVDGYQVEAPDNWLENGNPFELRRPEYTQEIHFGGYVTSYPGKNGRTMFRQEGYSAVKAVPYDMPVVGYGNGFVDTLRIWDAEPVNSFHLDSFDKGDYQKAVEEENLARTICEVLYPCDDHMQGKELRLKQQYFFVSASIQLAIKKFMSRNEDIHDLPKKAVFQMNDTHPTLTVPELMRILLDEYNLEWDEAWAIVQQCTAYTNHTIMAEALEKWPIELFSRLLPRIYQIVEEINRRFENQIHAKYDNTGVDVGYKISKMAVVYDGQVRMANMAIVAGFSVNGVAKLHTEILKNESLHDFYEMFPEKFNNKTNGITFRRWLLSCNHELANFLSETISDAYKKDANRLEDLLQYKDDVTVLDRLGEIKKNNKLALTDYIREHEGVELNPNGIFDIQIKRLHEYKRQQMNALYIIHKYLEIKNGKKPVRPLNFIFGAKAAPAYIIAQDIIHLLLVLQDIINNDPDVNSYMHLVFVTNYNVTYAEKLIPACEISEQISLASKEASGTSNMKFMLNGAVTLGTADGANVEIHQMVGDDNIYMFGIDSETVIEHYRKADYVSRDYYEKSPVIKEAVDFIVGPQCMKLGHRENLERLYSDILNKDWFMALIDLEDYIRVKDQMFADYEGRTHWNQMSLVNIAKAGFFSSDRTIAEYNRDIWKLK